MSTDDKAAREIDAIIETANDWRGETLAQLRAVILDADPGIVEEVKWKKPSKPEGVPVWSHDGNVCLADTLKKSVRLTFPKGAQIEDRDETFNSRLDSKTVRAIDYFEDDSIDASALAATIQRAVAVNLAKARKY